MSPDADGPPAPEPDWALFLDFDGTLVDIAERPDAIVVGPDLVDLLLRLRSRLAGALALVTGRTIAAVDGFLADAAIDVCGLHGLQRRIGGRTAEPPGLPDLGPEIGALRVAFASSPGVLVEDKRVGVALHWRLAPEAEGRAAAAMAALAERLGPAYRLQDGKCVRELVPAAAGKGAGIRAAMAEPPYLGRVPVFVGDDRTDEDGFLAVNAMGGLSIKVGPGETAAGARIARRADVPRWLHAYAAGTGGLRDLPAAGRQAPERPDEAVGRDEAS